MRVLRILFTLTALVFAGNAFAEQGMDASKSTPSKSGPELYFYGYKSCDGWNCTKTLCSNDTVNEKVVTSTSTSWCPIVGGPLCRTEILYMVPIKLNKLPNRVDQPVCPWLGQSPR